MSAVAEGGSKFKQYAPIIGAVLLVIIAVVVYSQSSGSVGTTTVPGTNNDATVAAVAQTNAQASAAYNQGIFSAFGSLASLADDQYKTDAQLAATKSTNATQFGEAQLQANALQTQYNDALQASQAQSAAASSNGFWGSISNIFSSGIGAAATAGLLSNNRSIGNYSVPAATLNGSGVGSGLAPFTPLPSFGIPGEGQV